MFRKIKDFFSGSSDLSVTLTQDKAGENTTRDLHIATAVLLVEIAGSDNDIAIQESNTLCAMMQQQFDISAEELPELLQIAVAARKEKGKIDDFVACLNQNFSDEQRLMVLAMIWKVILADGKIDKAEERFGLQLRNRLRLKEEHEVKALQLVKNKEV